MEMEKFLKNKQGLFRSNGISPCISKGNIELTLSSAKTSMTGISGGNVMRTIMT